MPSASCLKCGYAFLDAESGAWCPVCARTRRRKEHARDLLTVPPPKSDAMFGATSSDSDSGSTIRGRIKAIVCDVLGIPGNLVTGSSSFNDDLGANPSELRQIFEAIEEEFTTTTTSFKIPKREAAELKTLSDVAG